MPRVSALLASSPAWPWRVVCVRQEITRGSLAVRAFGAVLMFLCLAFAPILASDHARAAYVHFETGEGGAGLDARMELGENNRLVLAIMGCTISGNKINASAGLYVDGHTNLSPDLDKLRRVEDKGQSKEN